VLEWNSNKKYKAIVMAFFLAEKHLQDHGCIVVFHSWCANLKGIIVELCKTYPIMVRKRVIGNEPCALDLILEQKKF